jgi:hypothetical protein
VLSDTGILVDASGTIWTRGRGFRQLTAPDSSNVYTTAVNDSGAVLGQSFPGMTTTLYRWTPAGVAQALPYLDGRTTGTVVDLNDSGIAIGTTKLFNAVPHGTRWDRAGAAQDLGGVTNCDRSEPVAINDAGVIAGTIRLAGTATTASVPVVWRPVTR